MSTVDERILADFLVAMTAFSVAMVKGMKTYWIDSPGFISFHNCDRVVNFRHQEPNFPILLLPHLGVQHPPHG